MSVTPSNNNNWQVVKNSGSSSSIPGYVLPPASTSKAGTETALPLLRDDAPHHATSFILTTAKQKAGDTFLVPESRISRRFIADEDLTFLEEELNDHEIRQYVRRLHKVLRQGWDATLDFIEGYAAAGRVLKDADVRQSLREQLSESEDSHE